MSAIKTLSIRGYKSIRDLEDLSLGALNILIGANGAGKSNFISFFRFLRDVVDQRLQLAIAKDGGIDRVLYLGSKETKQITASLRFGSNGYDFSLEPTADDRATFSSERIFFDGSFGPNSRYIGVGNLEAKLKELKDETNSKGQHGVPHYVYDAVSKWVVYHFHDTSESALVRRPGAINIVDRLTPDASNLAAYLYSLSTSHPDTYSRLIDTVRLACPFFHAFVLKPMPSNPEFIRLEWLQVGSEYPLLASQLSDGTLRFICLVTALMQPRAPSTVLFDEPELGLHPQALSILANLFRQGTKFLTGIPFKQAIVSTQSASFLDYFLPNEVIVTERHGEESIFRKLDSSALETWLNDYSLGELWQKNLLGGRPRSLQGQTTLEKVG